MLNLLGLALALVAAPQSPVDQPRVETVRALLTRLSAATSSPIIADRDLAGQPVFVDAGSMTPQEVLDAVAAALRASVLRAAQGQRLTRTKDDERRRLHDAQGYWKELLGNWLQQAAGHASAAASLGSPAAQVAHYRQLVDGQRQRLREHQDAPITVTVNPSELDPGGVLFRQIVGRIGVDKLCNVGPEERRIWSNRPEGEELPCPDGDELLANFNQAQSQMGSQSAAAARFAFIQHEGVNFRIEVYDGAGNRITQWSHPPMGFNMAGPFLVSYERLANSPRSSPDSLIPLDASALDFERFAGERVIPPDLTPLERLPAAIRYADRDDPLEPTVGLGLRAMAAAAGGRGFVAVPNDSLLSMAEDCLQLTLSRRRLAAASLNVEAFGRLMLENVGFEQVTQGGVTILRPRDPFLASRVTADRFALSEQLKTLTSRPIIGASDVALAYAGVFPSEDSPVAQRVFTALFRTRPHSRSSTINAGGSGRLAMIGACLQQAQQAGTTAGLNGETEPLRVMINRGINDGWLRFESDTPTAAEWLSSSIVAASLQYRPQVYLGGDSVPVLAGLGVGHDTPPPPELVGYLPIEAIGAMYGSMAAQLHSIVGIGPAPTRDEVLEKIRSFCQFDLASNRQLKVYVVPYQGLRATLTLEETEVVAANVDFDDLPADVRKAFLAAAMRATGPVSNISTTGTSGGAGSKIPP